MRFNRNLIVSLLVLAGWPSPRWRCPGRIDSPSPRCGEAARTAELHPPVPVAHRRGRRRGGGEISPPGDPVMRLDSPDLALQLELTARRVDLPSAVDRPPRRRRATNGGGRPACWNRSWRPNWRHLRGLRAEAARLALTGADRRPPRRPAAGPDAGPVGPTDRPTGPYRRGRGRPGRVAARACAGAGDTRCRGVVLP